jgi:glycerol-3-phosphate dehydrogenase
VLVPRASAGALLLPTRDDRVLFVIPAGAHSILGTTDVDHPGGLDDVGATEDDVRFLLQEAAAALPRAALARRDVRAAWAALRPLAAAPGPPGGVSREYRIDVAASGLISVVGGKLTTHRSLAERVVDRVVKRSGIATGPSRTAQLPLDGGDVGELAAFLAGAAAQMQQSARIPLEQGERLARTYGTRVGELLGLLRADPALLARLCPAHPHLALEAAYAATSEMAVTLGDVLFRRMRVGFGACRGIDCAEATAAAMARVTGWSAARTAEEVAAYAQEARRLTLPREVA